MNRQATNTQTGATLIVAIMMLLIITLLALSSMRGVSLESRITGNLKLQRSLFNAAEAGLRMGESSVLKWQCNGNTAYQPCINQAPAVDTNGDYAAQFNTTNLPQINAVTGYDSNTVSAQAIAIQWYVTNLGTLGGISTNTGALGANGPYYEITACASTVLCSSDTTTQRVILRTVYAVSNPQ